MRSPRLTHPDKFEDAYAEGYKESTSYIEAQQSKYETELQDRDEKIQSLKLQVETQAASIRKQDQEIKARKEENSVLITMNKNLSQQNGAFTAKIKSQEDVIAKLTSESQGLRMGG